MILSRSIQTGGIFVTMNPATEAATLRELLRVLIRKLGILERSEASCCEMTLSQCHALVEIGRAGMLSVNQLSDRLGLDKSTVSRSADKLVLDGLLLREEAANDRRYVSLKLSNEGIAAYNNLEQRMTTYFDSVVKEIDPAEREMVLKGLHVLTTALKSNKCC
jgi:DNA-binding MarR family transcriptional regulator